MAFKSYREPKIPTDDQAHKRTAAEWQEAEQVARKRLRDAENSRARQHQMDRISYCQIARAIVEGRA